ncbi:MAG TPA: DUF4388 domain-containing protein [Pyrinomonadaceae bacterium]|nr:DUF4388 domain-containing protein [Pyrinomonadaceae bacterium]
MENIERTQFVVLTGHLDEQPLPELIRRLRAQRKSGRLQVEYADGPGSFFFEDGQMVDARLGALRGVEALYAALALDGASYNFNPLVRPPERNIDRQEQKFIWDLIEAPRREGLAEIKVAGRELDASSSNSPAAHAPRQLPAPAEELVAPLAVRLTAVEEAIVTTSRRFSRERLAYAMVIGFLSGLALVTTLSLIFDPFRPKSATPATSAANAPEVAPSSNATAADGRRERAAGEGGGASRQTDTRATNTNEQASGRTAEEQPPVPASAAVIGTRRADAVASPRGEYVVQVLVEVKAGRVVDARVWNPRPGAGAYESVALKMAKERRYPESFSGGERLRIRVKP